MQVGKKLLIPFVSSMLLFNSCDDSKPPELTSEQKAAQAKKTAKLAKQQAEAKYQMDLAKLRVEADKFFHDYCDLPMGINSKDNIEYSKTYKNGDSAFYFKKDNTEALRFHNKEENKIYFFFKKNGSPEPNAVVLRYDPAQRTADNPFAKPEKDLSYNPDKDQLKKDTKDFDAKLRKLKNEQAKEIKAKQEFEAKVKAQNDLFNSITSNLELESKKTRNDIRKKVLVEDGSEYHTVGANKLIRSNLRETVEYFAPDGAMNYREHGAKIDGYTYIIAYDPRYSTSPEKMGEYYKKQLAQEEKTKELKAKLDKNPDSKELQTEYQKELKQKQIWINFIKKLELRNSLAFNGIRDYSSPPIPASKLPQKTLSLIENQLAPLMKSILAEQVELGKHKTPEKTFTAEFTTKNSKDKDDNYTIKVIYRPELSQLAFELKLDGPNYNVKMGYDSSASIRQQFYINKFGSPLPKGHPLQNANKDFALDLVNRLSDHLDK